MTIIAVKASGDFLIPLGVLMFFKFLDISQKYEVDLDFLHWYPLSDGKRITGFGFMDARNKNKDKK